MQPWLGSYLADYKFLSYTAMPHHLTIISIITKLRPSLCILFYFFLYFFFFFKEESFFYTIQFK